jgi:hypothetical protein
MTIPVVNLADFEKGTSEQKSAFVQDLGKAYEDVGFVAVKNHGIPDELIADLYKYVQQFFSLPSEKKKSYENPELAGQRGYTSFGKEHAKGSDAPDLNFFNMDRLFPPVINLNLNTLITLRLVKFLVLMKLFSKPTVRLKSPANHYYRLLPCI